MKMPQSDQVLDFVSRFHERAALLQEVHEILLELYTAFLRVRTDGTHWRRETTMMRGWVENRKIVY